MNDQEIIETKTFVIAQADASSGHGDAHAAAPAAESHSAEAHAAPAAAEHSGDAHAAVAGHEAAAKAEEYPIPEAPPNIYDLIAAAGAKPGAHEGGHGGEEAHHGPFFVDGLFSAFYGLIFILVVARVTRRLSVTRPSRAQSFLEMLFEGIYNFFGSIIGMEHARQYMPFLGTLFIYIWLNNFAGAIPLLKSPTGHLETTAVLGFCAGFIFVNYNLLKAGGLKYYLWHLAGSPKSGVEWFFSPLIFLLEALGVFVRPVSLSLRLFGNIMGEDRLVGTFLGLGMLIASIVLGTSTPMIGVPLHFPFIFLLLLGSTIQATVFTLLTSVYIAMALPHDHDHGHDEEHARGEAEGHHHSEQSHGGHPAKRELATAAAH